LHHPERAGPGDGGGHSGRFLPRRLRRNRSVGRAADRGWPQRPRVFRRRQHRPRFRPALPPGGRRSCPDAGRHLPHRLAGAMSEPPTIFAVLTPPGTAAVATIALAGVRAWEVVRELFRPAGGRANPEEPDADRVWYGQFGDPPGDAVVLAARSAGPRPRIDVHF